MVDVKTNKIITELLAKLKKKYSYFHGLYLFGSRARGDYNDDSDYDFAIVFDMNIDSQLKREISDIMAIAMMDYEIIIDNPVFSYKDIKNPNMPIIDNIIKEGIFYD